MTQEKDITLDIAKIKNLPPLPEESLRIIAAVNDPDISIEALVDAISYMPTLSARLLGLANSAYFGQSVEITDLRTAIIQVLGLNLVKSLALSLALSAELNTSKCELFDTDFYWNHTLFTALIAQKLAVKLNDENLEPNIVYSIGLLLNIGLLAAVHVAPEPLNQIFANSDRISGSVSSSMIKMFGNSQYQLGGLLLERWKLPLIYQTTVKKFQQTEDAEGEQTLFPLLELSHWASTHIVTDTHENMPDFSSLLSKISLSKKAMEIVVEDVVNSKENIRELALVMGR